MVALQTLRGINSNLETVQSEISTGKKVATAKDNAAIWAISTVMSTDVESFNQITDSLNKGSSTVGVARAASEQVTSLLQDMKELIVSAQEDLNADDRSKIQTDIDAKRTAISNIINAAQFNGQNLLKGTDSVSILASLDRGSDGTVSATSITVERKDLQTSAAVDAAAKEATDAGYAATEDSATINNVAIASGKGGYITLTGVTSDATSSGGDATFTFKGGAIAAGDKFTVNVGGTDFSYTAVTDDTINDVANALATKVTDADGAAAITNYDDVAVTEAANPLTGDVTLVFSADSGQTLAVTAANTAATTQESVIEEDDSIEITFAGGTISKGDTFTVAGQTYTAEADDTINDVANGLAALLEDEGITNLVVEVTEADDPTTDAATLTLTATDGDVEISITDLGSQNAAVAAGGLGAIAGLSVETAADATTALNTIEALLDTSISAATAFGSAQTQIEGQGEFVQTLIDSMTSGIGAMVDADIEAASAKLQALQVQQQLGVQALSIANSNPQTLLSLFR
tara:strand:+ start:7793 stop:9352 length:1560 start_codon:yes stop_codon:yes gene_type:complete